MKKLGFLITMLVIASLPAWSQGAKSIRITEVMTHNRDRKSTRLNSSH